MRYGDKRTAYSGVLQWLQGVRNRPGHGHNYTRGMDWNQMNSFAKKVMIEFMQIKGVEVPKKFNPDKAARAVQDNFNEFVVFMKSKQSIEK